MTPTEQAKMDGRAVVRGAHLTGSVPLADNEIVFRTAADRLGRHLHRIPDGETGVRTNWIEWQQAIFAGHPGLETIPPDAEAYRPMPTYRLREGVDPAGLDFGPLGYAEAATDSWAVFERLRDEGAVPEEIRFQVSLPTPLAPIGLYAYSDHAVMETAYETAMLRELAAIVDAVPHDSLAIQWDTAVEFGMLEGVFPSWIEDLEPGIVERLIRLAGAVPEDVEFGFHLCYGDAGHRHFVEPADTGRLVAIANAVADGLDRGPQWVHMPVPRDRTDPDYFAPLEDLRLPPETELYLGLVHATDGSAGAAKRIEAASDAVTGFGVGTECGFGRRPADTVASLLDQHAEISAALR